MADTSTAGPRGVCLRSALCLGRRRQLIAEDLRMLRRPHSRLRSWKLALRCQSGRNAPTLNVFEWMRNGSSCARGRLTWRQCMKWVGVRR